MRRESLFSAGGFYRFLVEANVLMHREAIEAGTAALRRRFHAPPTDRVVRVLDLACGGQPVAIAGILAAMAEMRFEYLGLDINPDQVRQGRAFGFADNVVRAEFREASAWYLDGLAPSTFDIVFSALNLHHGTPEEIEFLVRQLDEVLAAGGVFLGHDWYRPNGTVYCRRPDAGPPPTCEGFHMVASGRLRAAGLEAPPVTVCEQDPPWRRRYIDTMRQVLLDRGAPAAEAQSVVAHVAARDFPISTNELSEILARHGFRVDIDPYAESNEPLALYTYFIAAERGLSTVAEGTAQ